MTVLDEALAEKNALGINVSISSVPGNKGKQLATVPVGVLAPVAAIVALAPNPKKAVTVPVFRIRYWLPPNVVDTACVAAGAGVVAVITIVLPVTVKGALTLIARFPLV